MTDPWVDGPASKEEYLQWRARLADKQAARRQPGEFPTAQLSSEWDPGALFVTHDASEPDPTDRDLAVEQAIDLRAAEPAAAPEPLEAPVSPAAPAPDARGDVEASRALPTTETEPEGSPGDARRAHFDSVMARLERMETKQAASPSDPRRARYDSVMARLEKLETKRAAASADAQRAHHDLVMARLERSTNRSTREARLIDDALRQLNERRLEGAITDHEFNARKAELFERLSSGRRT